MPFRRSITGGALAALVVSSGWIAPTVPRAALQGDTCSVSVSGAEDPTKMPDALVWEAVFKQQRGAALQAPPAAPASAALVSALRTTGTVALDRVEALRATLRVAESGPGATSRDRDLLVADTILDARDAVAGRSSPEEFDAMLTLAESAARRLSFAVPSAGQTATLADGRQVCRASIVGKDAPQLIPDHVVWSSVFRMFARAAATQRGTDGRVSDEFVIAQQRTGMPSPAADVRAFVDVAAEAAADIAAEQSTAGDGSREASLAQLVRLQRVVMKARLRVQRRVSAEGWRGILARVEKSREDTQVFFSSAR